MWHRTKLGESAFTLNSVRRCALRVISDWYSVVSVIALSCMACSHSCLQWKTSFTILNCPWNSTPSTWFWVLFEWADQSVVDWWACGLNLNSVWTLVFRNSFWLRDGRSAVGSSQGYIYLLASKVLVDSIFLWINLWIAWSILCICFLKLNWFSMFLIVYVCVNIFCFWSWSHSSLLSGQLWCSLHGYLFSTYKCYCNTQVRGDRTNMKMKKQE